MKKTNRMLVPKVSGVGKTWNTSGYTALNHQIVFYNTASNGDWMYNNLLTNLCVFTQRGFFLFILSFCCLWIDPVMKNLPAKQLCMIISSGYIWRGAASVKRCAFWRFLDSHYLIAFRNVESVMISSAAMCVPVHAVLNAGYYYTK